MHFRGTGSALVCRTLVKCNLMNVTDDVQKIFRETLIWKITAVEEKLDLTTFPQQSSEDLRSDLKDLLYPGTQRKTIQ